MGKDHVYVYLVLEAYILRRMKAREYCVMSRLEPRKGMAKAENEEGESDGNMDYNKKKTWASLWRGSGSWSKTKKSPKSDFAYAKGKF